MIVQVAYYIGKKKLNHSARLFDRLVCWRTKSNYSHCELVIDGVCYSSSARDGGVRSKLIDLNSGKWDVFSYEINVTESDMFKTISAKLGMKYDYAGIFGFVLPFNTESKSRYFCSEFCAAILGIPKPWRYSPGKLHKYYKDRRKAVFLCLRGSKT